MQPASPLSKLANSSLALLTSVVLVALCWIVLAALAAAQTVGAYFCLSCAVPSKTKSQEPVIAPGYRIVALTHPLLN